MRRLWLATLMAVLAGPAGAREVPVRSGEHGYFTRIVLDTRPGEGWELGREGADYVLLLNTANLTADLDGVYENIPRTRLIDISLLSDRPGLRLTVAEGAHAVAFRAEGGQAVVDIIDGPPASGSPFETQIAVLSPPSGPSRPLRRPGQESSGPAPKVGNATLNYRPSPNAAASLPVYWRNVLPEGMPGEDAAPMPADHPRLPHPGPDRSDPSPDPPAAGPGAVPPVLPWPEPGPPVLPDLPDRALLAVEEELRFQIARAASQGLASVAPDWPGAAPDTERPDKLPYADVASAPQGESDDNPDGPTPAFHAETALDRGAGDRRAASRTRVPASDCPGAEVFDVASWAGDEPPDRQLAAARTGLVGEFDRPAPGGAERLARLYLFFGMGAEAAQIARAFGLSGQDGEIIRDMALILDGRRPDADGTLARLGGCDGNAMLWAFIANADETRLGDAEAADLTLAFSGLPAGLRRQIGPTLADRLISIGRLDQARTVRNAVARRPGDEGDSLALMDAGLALAAGERASAVAHLDALAATPGPLDEDALVHSVRVRIETGEPVDPARAEALSSLAFERRYGSDAAELAQLDILAMASSGNLRGGFRRAREWMQTGTAPVDNETLESLFSALALDREDADFLALYFSERDLLEKAEIRSEVRIALAERMAQLGLADDVRRLVGGAQSDGARARLVLARAALAAHDPEAALDLAATSAGADALRLRAEALTLQGRHLDAAAILARLGDRAAQSGAAWRGGDLEQAAAADAGIAEKLKPLGIGRPDAAAATGGAPTLASGRDLVEQSAGFRNAIEHLLADAALSRMPDGASADETAD
jgi:hypothetical protein